MCKTSIWLKFAPSSLYILCLFVSKKSQNCWTDQAQIFCGINILNQKKGYGWSSFQKFATNKILFLNILKIHEIFFKNPRILF